MDKSKQMPQVEITCNAGEAMNGNLKKEGFSWQKEPGRAAGRLGLFIKQRSVGSGKKSCEAAEKEPGAKYLTLNIGQAFCYILLPLTYGQNAEYIKQFFAPYPAGIKSK
jgi:hypothetical protein